MLENGNNSIPEITKEMLLEIKTELQKLDKSWANQLHIQIVKNDNLPPELLNRFTAAKVYQVFSGFTRSLMVKTVVYHQALALKTTLVNRLKEQIQSKNELN